MPDDAPPKSPQPAPETAPHPESLPFSVLHAYGWLRRRLGQLLGRGSRHKLARWAVWPLCALAAVLDLPLRWLATFLDTLIGNKGYLTVGSIAAVYLAIFGLIDNKSTQEETQASVERSLFMTLVSSGNAASFVAAMKDFGPTQTVPVTEHPSLFKFWEWGRTHSPNREPMQHWAEWRLPLCSLAAQDCSLGGKSSIDLSRANLRGADLSYADLSNANLSYASLIVANLSGADLSNANLTGTDLTGTDLSGADLSNANLSVADLSHANLSHATLTQAFLRHAVLRTATGLTQTQLDPACGDGAKLPEGLTLRPCPENWQRKVP